MKDKIKSIDTNATYLFEKPKGALNLPSSSESFWTSLFSFFLVDISKKTPFPLSIWMPNSGKCDGHPFYYERKPNFSYSGLTNLTFEMLSVEPKLLNPMLQSFGYGIDITGISPDIVLGKVENEKIMFTFIEVKIGDSSGLNHNQRDAYPKLVERLNQNENVGADLLVLHSVGCTNTVCDSLSKLEQRLGEHFGVLLWEDVFRVMGNFDYCIAGLDKEQLTRYTEDAIYDCKEW